MGDGSDVITRIESNGCTFIRAVKECVKLKGSSKIVVRCVNGHERVTLVKYVLRGKGCPHCANQYRYTEKERVNQINNIEDVTFVSWVDGSYVSSKSKAVCRCPNNHEWSVRVDALIRGSKCPACFNQSRATPQYVREAAINAKCNCRFVRWEQGMYVNWESRAVCLCDSGHEWSASVGSLLTAGSGCPDCAGYGYNPTAAGTLYLLRSECGRYCKIGISNNHNARLEHLRRVTPFGWQLVELVEGDGAFVRSLEKALHNMTSQVDFDVTFDGYTEWRYWTPSVVSWFKLWQEAQLCR